MNGKLDITECDNPVLSHRVATATGDLDQLCVDLTFFTFIFSSFIVYVLMCCPGHRRYLTFESPRDIL